MQSDFPTLGYVGDKVNVAKGYARNFLIPRGIAVESSSKNEHQIRHLLAGIDKKRARLRVDAEEFAKKLAAITLEFTLKVGEGGKTFGAITSKDIEAALKAKGLELLRKQIRLVEPLKKAGDYTVTCKLHSEVSGTVAIKMLLEGLHPKQEGDETKPKRGGRGGARRAARKDQGAEGESQSELQAEANTEGATGEADTAETKEPKETKRKKPAARKTEKSEEPK